MPYQDKDPLRTDIGGKFPLGKTVFSDGVQALVHGDPIAPLSLNAFLRLHHTGRWGAVSTEDAGANDRALADGGPIVSRYQVQGRMVLIVTDAEPRESTTVMLEEEYPSS